jgi:glycine cleavage system H protein
VKQGDAPCVVDSVKAASDVYAPVGGTVTEANAALADAPELVNTEAESGGWLFRLTLADPGQLGGLMDRPAYDEYVKGL